MGCIVANKDTVKNHKAAIDAFLAEYAESIEYIGDNTNIESSAQYIVDAGIMTALP